MLSLSTVVADTRQSSLLRNRHDRREILKCYLSPRRSRLADRAVVDTKQRVIAVAPSPCARVHVLTRHWTNSQEKLFEVPKANVFRLQVFFHA